MQIAQRAPTTAAAPFGGEDDEIERPRLLDLQPRPTAPSGGVRPVDRLRHHALVASGERVRRKCRRLLRTRGHDSRDTIRRCHMRVEYAEAARERLVDE